MRDADPEQVAKLRAAFPGRELIFKIGRFSPDKRWNMAMDALAQEKGRGRGIAAVIRGGVEPHGAEVLANARNQGLTVADVKPPREVGPAIEALADAGRSLIHFRASRPSSRRGVGSSVPFAETS